MINSVIAFGHIIQSICLSQDSVEVVVFDGDPEKTTAIVMNYFRSRSYTHHLAWAKLESVICGNREAKETFCKYKREGMCPNLSQTEHHRATNGGTGGSSKGEIFT